MLKLRVGAGICQTCKGGSWVRRVMFQEVRAICLSWLQCSGRDTIPDRLEKDAQNNLLNDPISCG